MDSENAKSLELVRTFAAWVPTITGQLSFSLIGRVNRADILVANDEGDDHPLVPTRYVVGSQSRKTTDLPFTFWPISLLKPSIKAEYFLVARSISAPRPTFPAKRRREQAKLATHKDEIGAMEGSVVVVPYQEDGEWWRQKAADLVNSIKREIAQASGAPFAQRTSASTAYERVSARIDRAQSEGELTIFQCKFTLYRTGEFRLKLPKISVLLPNNENIDAEQSDYDIISKQIYYFVKDVSHQHQHHTRNSDNLLPIVRSPEDDDTSWRRETLWALARAIIEHRRRNKLPGHKSALGMLAYAESFQEHLASIRRKGEEFEIWEGASPYDFSHVKMSLEATIDEQNFKNSTLSQYVATLLASALALVALWIGAVQISKAVCLVQDKACIVPTVPSDARTVMFFFIQNPTKCAMVGLTIGLLWFEFSRRSLSNITTIGRIQDFVRGWIYASGATLSRALQAIVPGQGDMIAWVAVLLGWFAVLGIILRFILPFAFDAARSAHVILDLLSVLPLSRS